MTFGDAFAKASFDTISVTIMLGTIADWLPPIAAGVSIIWGLIRIYETQTVQRWMYNRKNPDGEV